MLRQFVSSTRSGEEGDPLQETLWIYTPDYDNHGSIHPVKNITIARSEYAQYWKDLDVIKSIEQNKFPLSLNTTEVTAVQHWMSFDQIQTLEITDSAFMNLIDFYNLNNYDKLTWT
jgi:hypothetical protein